MIKHIKKEQLEKKTWSGGTTTELFIFPPKSDYKSLNFDYRISTASVDVETSKFTSLPGVNRLIMSLTGPLKLIHEGQHTAVLDLFDVDTFKGEWETTSYGKVTDFNLMFKDTHSASMAVKIINNVKDFTNEETTIVYAFEEGVHINISDKVIDMKQGDLLVVTKPCQLSIKADHSKVIVCKLKEK